MDKKRIIAIFIIVFILVVGLIFSIYYSNNKYSVSFETGTNDILLTKYVKKGGKISKPTDPSKDGYVFIEWQLNGKKFDFNTKIKSDIVLNAKWVKEEYITIKFITNNDDIIKDIKVLKGSILNELPELSKDGYEFIGWYITDKKYNNQEIYSDITLEAKFNEINKFDIGSKVIIDGSYSSSAYNTISPYTAALGWEREILDIIEESYYPYVVGNSSGVTGFFKEDSIKLLGVRQ